MIDKVKSMNFYVSQKHCQCALWELAIMRCVQGTNVEYIIQAITSTPVQMKRQI